MITTILNETYEGIIQGSVGPALTYLYAGLHEERQQLTDREWQERIQAVCLPHPLTHLIHQDPLIERALIAGLRGGKGTELLAYFCAPVPLEREAMTPLGRALFGYTATTGLAAAFRSLHQEVERQMADASGLHEDARSLVIDRTQQFSAAPASAVAQLDFRWPGNHGRLHDVAPLSPRPPQGARPEHLPGYDFVTSPLLFSRLTQPEAAALITRMWAALRPGGVLLLANLLPGVVETAFLECYAGVRFCYRSLQEIGQLLHHIPVAEIGDLTLEADSDRVLGVLTLQKEMV